MKSLSEMDDKELIWIKVVNSRQITDKINELYELQKELKEAERILKQRRSGGEKKE